MHMDNLIRDVYWEMDWSEKKQDGTRRFPDKPEKEKMFDENLALAMLLNNQVVFINSHWYADGWPTEAKESFSINCDCSDTFYYASADAVEVKYHELKDLYDHVLKDPKFGSVIWCSKKRKILPLKQICESIKKDGIWDLSEILL